MAPKIAHKINEGTTNHRDEARRKDGAENRPKKLIKLEQPAKTGELTPKDEEDRLLANHKDRASGHTPQRVR